MKKRLYKFKKKHVRKDGTVTIGPNSQWKWVKGETKQGKYRPRGQSKTLWSRRFGYLDNYTHDEQKLLRCPSGYTFGQGMHALRRLWFAYRISKSEANLDKMEHYAKAIQEVQEDMGLKTTSFPHLGIYGDQLTLYDHSTPELKILSYADHSDLLNKQKLEEEKEKFAELVPLIEADLEKGEKLITIADEIPKLKPEPEPEPRHRIKHDNRMHFHEKQKEESTCDECGEIIPPGKNHICDFKKEEERESLITIADEIPEPKPKYRIKHGNRMNYGKKRSDEWVCENCDETVPANRNHICNHKEEENLLIITDDIPFESSQEN